MPVPVRVFITVGQRFGRLTVLRTDVKTGPGKRVVVCLCDCGTQTNVLIWNLTHGHTKSCGCLSREARETALARRKRNSVTGTPEHRAWINLRHRCLCKTCKSFPRYGGRGIGICDAWRDSFQAFLRDVGLRPSPEHSIDRIDNNGHYEPSNVRWATLEQQASNTSRVDLITYEGVTLPLKKWALRVGLSQPTLRRRLRILGWSIKKALTTSSKLYHHR